MGGFVWVFPDIGRNAGTPPGGGVRFVGWVGGLLSLVDRQHCSWAEAPCDTGCCHFVQTCFAVHSCNGHHFHFSLYMVLKRGMAGTFSDPVVIAQASQMKGVSSNPALHSFSTCYGVVNLKLLCDAPRDLHALSDPRAGGLVVVWGPGEQRDTVNRPENGGPGEG